MRVCFVTTTFPDFAGSPRGTFIVRLAELLTQRGLDVTVVTPQVLRRSLLREQFGFVRVRRFRFLTDGRQLAEYERVPVLRMVTYMISGIIATCRAVAEQQSDLIHGHWVIPAGLIAVIVGAVMRKPVVLSAHGSDILVWSRRRLIRVLTAWTLRRSHECSANSVPMRETIIAMGQPPAGAPIVYEVGVDTARFHPHNDGANWRARLGLGCGHCVVLFLGHLVKRKGVDVLIAATAKLATGHPALRVVIAGDGPERDALVSQTAAHSLQNLVQLIGAVDHGEAHDLFAAADIFALPSRNEALGIVLMEAMASGKPIVASRVDGIPDIVRDEACGLLADAEDADDFAAKLARLLDGADLRRALGANGRREAGQRYQENLQVDRVVAMYARALSATA